MFKANEIVENFDNFKSLLERKTKNLSKELETVKILDKKRRNILVELEKLRSSKNDISKQIGILARQKDLKSIEKLKIESNKSNLEIIKLETEINDVETKLDEILLSIPNLPLETVPVGKDENENVEIRKVGEIKVQNNEPHWDIALKLGLVDFEYATSLSGSRFVAYTDKGAKLVRCIVNELMDLHNKNGYKEYSLPVIVSRETMIGTGQLPKFEDDMYKVDNNQFLISTGEITLTNIFRNKIIDQSILPINMTTFSQCFRKEAGSAGRDTKGLIRLHQFNKVELVKIVSPETSEKELEILTKNAGECLELFELPYRVVELCTGDLGFSARKTYDLETWFPNQNKYREISSCSNCYSFQAKRMNTKFKNKDNKKEYVHTLNGSGVAIDRLIAAILENYWDGNKLKLPKVLRKYFNNQEYI
ncbi:serine--tRNA ligase [Spiroplasma endosymbiont of Crioceris asparagi]|uniref:serine--tRNA ligase n=1 Tax=Spiroplasma endosymbiont of Crioceris asparagi TaxID=3066286 RepID=UPI0030CD8F54